MARVATKGNSWEVTFVRLNWLIRRENGKVKLWLVKDDGKKEEIKTPTKISERVMSFWAWHYHTLKNPPLTELPTLYAVTDEKTSDE